MQIEKPHIIKAKVKLYEYALLQGYKIDKRKSSTTYVKLVNENTGDKILININPSGGKDEVYKSLLDPMDKGDIFSFVANRINGIISVDKTKETFHKTLIHLNEFSSGDQWKNEDIKKVDKFIAKKKTMKSVVSKDFNEKPIETFTYLTDKRKISILTLKSKVFEGKLFNTFFQLPNSHIITNYGYGKFEQGALVGMEVKNENFNSLLGNTDALFSTNPTKEGPIDLVFISESAHDVMAHYELLMNNKNFNKDQNIIYFSMGGNLYDNKIDSLLKEYDYCNCNKNTNFVSITDNDKAGNEYDIKLAVAHINKFRTPVSEGSVNAHFHVLEFKRCKFMDDATPKLKKIVNSFNSEIEKLNNKDNYGKYHIVKEDDEKITFFLSKETKSNSIFFKDFLHCLKSKNLLSIHKPKNHKDWNDLLINKKEEFANTLKSNREHSHKTSISKR